jgi:transcriptional regulator with XRE-family HTH domain
MSLFSDNIRQLRIKKYFSGKLAQNLLITRRYVKYEDGSSEPPYDILKRMSYYFHVSIDILLSVDVQKILIEDLLNWEIIGYCR